MTNKEAIEVMERIARWQATKLETTESIEAMDMAIAALREKADKERRYVVKEYTRTGITLYQVYDNYAFCNMAWSIPEKQAAQAIADIYEGMEQ